MDGWGGVEVERDGARAGEAGRFLGFGAMSSYCFSAGDGYTDWDLALSMTLSALLCPVLFSILVGFSSLPLSKEKG